MSDVVATAETQKLNFASPAAVQADQSGAAIPGENGAVAENDAPATEATTEVAEATNDHSGAEVTISATPADTDDVAAMLAEKERLEREIEAKQKEQRSGVIAEIKKVVDTYKIPVAELVAALGGVPNPRKGTKAKPKYRDPATGNTWSGRGKAPNWLKDKDRNQFLITE